MAEAEQDTIGRAKKGDEKAFEALMKDALPKVLGLSRRMLRDESESWDVAQEAFVKAWKRLTDFRGDAAFSTWVSGIASHIAIDRLRERRRESGQEVDERVAAGGHGPERTAENSSLAAAITGALSELPDAERNVFLLHEESGMKYREVAAALEIPIGTVMSRLHSARSKLQKILQPWWKEMNT